MLLWTLILAFSAAWGGVQTKGLAAQELNGKFSSIEFERRDVTADDVLITVRYSGICHTDIHQHEGSLLGAFPLVPGHEYVGTVAQVGKSVRGLKQGDTVGVGAVIDSCGQCEQCRGGHENLCAKALWQMPFPSKDGVTVKGGWSKHAVINHRFAYKIPKDIPLQSAAPLMCAGVTVYAPLKRLGVKKGTRVGVAGFGGLGHLAVKLAVSMGAEVTVFDLTDEKEKLALQFGAKHYVNVTKENPFAPRANSLDVILSTIPASFDVNAYLGLLKPRGTLVPIGGHKTLPVSMLLLNVGEKRIEGSIVASPGETREFLTYAARHRIQPEVEVISASDVNEALPKVKAGKARFRYVIDMDTL